MSFLALRYQRQAFEPLTIARATILPDSEERPLLKMATGLTPAPSGIHGHQWARMCRLVQPSLATGF